MVFCDLGLNPGLRDYWRTLYPLGQWADITIKRRTIVQIFWVRTSFYNTQSFYSVILFLVIWKVSILCWISSFSNYFRIVPNSPTMISPNVTFIFCRVGWGCGIYRLHLCRRVKLHHQTSVLDMTLNNLMVRFQ